MAEVPPVENALPTVGVVRKTVALTVPTTAALAVPVPALEMIPIEVGAALKAVKELLPEAVRAEKAASAGFAALAVANTGALVGVAVKRVATVLVVEP